MSYRALLVVRWLRYAEYVAVWETIPLPDRPRYQVCRVGDEWIATPIQGK